MTRRYRKWLPYEVAALVEWAGTVPTAEIAERLGRSAKSVDHKAKAMGLSLRCEWHLEWCNGCSCWRTSVDADTGECQVCKVRHKMQATEAECTAASCRASAPSQSRLRARRTSKACQKRSAAKPSSGSSKNWRNGTLPTCKGATQRPANGSKGRVKIL